MSETTRLYADITARSITPQVLLWLEELDERFGDGRVQRMLEEEGAKGNHKGLIGRVRNRLAEADAAHRPSRRPRELDRDTLLAMVRGQIPEPERPFIYDTRDLSQAEYGEVIEWAQRVQRGHALGVPA